MALSLQAAFLTMVAPCFNKYPSEANVFANSQRKAFEGFVMLGGILSALVLGYQGASRVARYYGPLQAIGLVVLTIVAILVIQRAVRREVQEELAAREFLQDATDQEFRHRVTEREEEYTTRMAGLVEREKYVDGLWRKYREDSKAREEAHASAIAKAKQGEESALARLKFSEDRIAELRQALDAHQQRPPCPKCGGRPIPIAYGLPGPEMMDQAERGEIALGGCTVGLPNEPHWTCRKCHESWPDPELEALRKSNMSSF